MSTIWTDLLGAQVHFLGRQYRTRVIEAGEGPALLLVHGIGGHAEAWARNVVRLGQDRRAMAIDLLWHGYSSKPAYVDGQDIPAYAAQIIDLMDSQDIERADIEGESLGGWVGLWLALHHPERVGKLVLNTTAGIRWAPEPATDHADHGHHDHAAPATADGKSGAQSHGGRSALAERSLAAISNPTLETIRKRLEWLMASPDRVTDELVEVRHHLYSDPEVQASLRSVFLNAFAGEGAPRKEIDEAELADVAAPTLVLWTEHNPGSGLDVGRKIASRIPGAQFACVADAGHWPQWEHPEEHDGLVSRFLNGEYVNQA